MIYDFPDRSEPIRQGDIFSGLPRIDFSLEALPIIKDDEQTLMPWEEVAQSGEPVTALVALRPVTAIVASQDCDVTHGRDITLCEIRSFRTVELQSKDTQAAKKWVNVITQQARKNLKWFYLPPDRRVGFTEKMGVDFMVTLRVPRYDLESLRNRRMGRLNQVADEHFRERIAEFFRRFPYDEWYPLNREEFEIYKKEYSEVNPFPWQIGLTPQE